MQINLFIYFFIEISDLIIFPFLPNSGVAQLIITCQHGEIRVWNLANGKELRRFVLANKVCNAIAISRDGKVVVSGECKV